jgi:hypothetical protein
MYQKRWRKLVSKYDLEKLHHLTTDGISSLIMERLNNMPER